jgi:hypothetical protein
LRDKVAERRHGRVQLLTGACIVSLVFRGLDKELGNKAKQDSQQKTPANDGGKPLDDFSEHGAILSGETTRINRSAETSGVIGDPLVRAPLGALAA